jgi:methylglyoxal synthase
MPEIRTLILLAHKRHLPALGKLMKKERAVFETYRLLSTVEVGTVIEKEVGVEVTSVFPASKGGEIQLCGLVCSNSVAAVYFLRDPLSPEGSEPEISPFYRACDLNNVPLATNLLTAVALTHWLGRKIAEVEP